MDLQAVIPLNFSVIQCCRLLFAFVVGGLIVYSYFDKKLKRHGIDIKNPKPPKAKVKQKSSQLSLPKLDRNIESFDADQIAQMVAYKIIPKSVNISPNRNDIRQILRHANIHGTIFVKLDESSLQELGLSKLTRLYILDFLSKLPSSQAQPQPSQPQPSQPQPSQSQSTQSVLHTRLGNFLDIFDNLKSLQPFIEARPEYFQISEMFRPLHTTTISVYSALFAGEQKTKTLLHHMDGNGNPYYDVHISGRIGFNSGINGSYHVFGMLNNRPAYLCTEKRKLLWWDGKDWKVAKPDPSKMINRACYAHCSDNASAAQHIDKSSNWRVKTHHDHGEWEEDSHITVVVRNYDIYLLYGLQLSTLVRSLSVPDVILNTVIQYCFAPTQYDLQSALAIPRFTTLSNNSETYLDTGIDIEVDGTVDKEASISAPPDDMNLSRHRYASAAGFDSNEEKKDPAVLPPHVHVSRSSAMMDDDHDLPTFLRTDMLATVDMSRSHSRDNSLSSRRRNKRSGRRRNHRKHRSTHHSRSSVSFLTGDTPLSVSTPPPPPLSQIVNNGNANANANANTNANATTTRSAEMEDILNEARQWIDLRRVKHIGSDMIEIDLRLNKHASQRKKYMTVKFTFDMINENADTVATEMISVLDLDSSLTPYIAAFIRLACESDGNINENSLGVANDATISRLQSLAKHRSSRIRNKSSVPQPPNAPMLPIHSTINSAANANANVNTTLASASANAAPTILYDNVDQPPNGKKQSVKQADTVDRKVSE